MSTTVEFKFDIGDRIEWYEEGRKRWEQGQIDAYIVEQGEIFYRLARPMFECRIRESEVRAYVSD